jgi:hypothetical protein
MRESIREFRTVAVIWAAVLASFPAAFIHAQGDVLFVQGNNVGIGTNAPGARLDVRPSSGTSIELRVKNDAKNTDVLSVLQSENDNQIFRIFEAASGEGVFSVFAANGVENLRFTGQAGGRLGIGCAQGISADIVLNSAGGGVCGTGTESTINAGATAFTVTSSRSIKKNVEAVEVEGLLEKVSRVGVYRYDFVSGPEDNLGLMAEDFHQVFGRGSDKLLDGHEVTMALWLAVRELTSRTDELARQNDALAAQNEVLRLEIEGLRDRR